ncbi:hypothetical protein AAL_01464 [Moelleriella libera RCEF 2490]|uniref:Uncharacterized protein n=1 Tax=Moelleriella libera RCEF 2490 TaxID=1081109 RepID=A0A166U6X2_9HYPO|nr:hypothetical protein AAL_01464 [Moelleriella libera RCEF 2490]
MNGRKVLARTNDRGVENQTYCRVARPRTVFPATPDPLTLAPDDTTTRPEGVGVVAEDEDGRPRGHCGADGLGPPRATDDGINGSQARGRAGWGGREAFTFAHPSPGFARPTAPQTVRL